MSPKSIKLFHNLAPFPDKQIKLSSRECSSALSATVILQIYTRTGEHD